MKRESSTLKKTKKIYNLFEISSETNISSLMEKKK